MERPRCKRCNGPLDLWCEDGKLVLICNNPNTLETDAEFAVHLDKLSSEEIAQLQEMTENGEDRWYNEGGR